MLFRSRVSVIFTPVPDTVPGVPATVTAQEDAVVPGVGVADGVVGLGLAGDAEVELPQAPSVAARAQAARLVAKR